MVRGKATEEVTDRAVALRTYCRACALTHDVSAHTDRAAMLLEAQYAEAVGDVVTAAVWRARAASRPPRTRGDGPLFSRAVGPK